jgi:fucose 4-O-acetylase-like acetyltransferase
MDVMLALGIIFVVMGHNYQPNVLFLQAYTFQVALFFFVSGYFFKARLGLRDKLLWLKKKAINLLGPYFVYNIFYAVITFYLVSRGISLGVSTNENFNFYRFFITPFINGHQYFLYLAAWFVPQLFLIHLSAQFIIIKESQFYIFGLLIISLGLSYLFIDKYAPSQGDLLLVLGRTAFGLSFYLLGKLLNIFEANIKRYLCSPEAFVLIYIVYVSLESFFGGFRYSLVVAEFSNHAAVTLIGTTAAILMIYIISDYVGKSISENSLILKIGRNTFSIMANHLLVFFSINYIFYKLTLIPAASLSDVFASYKLEKLWFVYLILGVGLPLLFSLFLKRFTLSKVLKLTPLNFLKTTSK